MATGRHRAGWQRSSVWRSALVDRAEALLTAVRADIRGPAGSRLAEEVTSLVQRADIFHDGIDLDARPDDVAAERVCGGRGGFRYPGGRYGRHLAQRPRPRRLAVLSDDRDALATVPEAPVRQADHPPARFQRGQTPVLALADRLITQADEFLVVFTREARIVPEGGYFIADVRASAVRRPSSAPSIPRAIDVGQLAFAFGEVDAMWQILARRTNRIAQGRTGSNVQRIEGIGQTVAEIHRLLGMPGIPAVVGPFGG